MTAHLNLLPHKVLREDRADGSILLRSARQVGPVARCTGEWLHHWAQASPEQVFLAEREGPGWRTVTYRAALDQVRSIASHLMTRALGPKRPIMILSGNGVDHGLLTLAAQYVGVPTVPVAEQYALIPAAQPRLEYVARLVNPGLIYAADAAQFNKALSLPVFEGIEVLSSAPGGTDATAFEDLRTPSGADIEQAYAAITPDTVAKVLLTSGSTSDPKGVLTTQRMLTTNQAQVAPCLPFVTSRPPRIVDWLPWNHVFGGSYNFNLMLANGGSLYIDDGKPAPGLFDRTLENLGQISGTISFNVPLGFAKLVAALERNTALRETYFAELDMIFYAGASLPQDTWSALERLSMETCGKLPLITSSWGLTETAPGALFQHEPAKGAGIVGVPLPGLTTKLLDDGTGRFEVRVKGDNITPGYLNDPQKTADAFDEEEFFRSGDAMRFVDPLDANKGLRFDGRLSEDFKLMTGTWVHAARMRLELLAALAPNAADLVLAGEGRSEIGILIVPNEAALKQSEWECHEDAGALICQPLFQALAEKLAAHNLQATGSASRIGCALVMAEPPFIGDGEVTAKGNLNYRKLLSRRSGLVDRLYDRDDPARLGLD